MRGLRIALTGGLEGLSRAGFKGLLSKAGALFAPTVDTQTDLLVVGSAPLSSKIDEAKRLGVPTETGQVFMLRLKHPLLPEPMPQARSIVPSLEIGEKTVRILDIELKRRPRGERTPVPDSFRGYTLDGPTIEMLRHLSRAVLLGHPCLITGDTATSKSSAIRFLGSLIGAEVVRLNLNGQTDTGELVGRYVPHGAGWRFAEGLVPLAMRHGWWLVLDEVNLAEPAVIERLNPCLERVPTLVLTEGPGTRFGPNADVEVHPNFRVFATLNPPRYVGRSALSAAWRDRFVSQIVARPPGELEFLQLLEHLVTGHQPTIELNGVQWAPGPSWGQQALKLSALMPLWPRVATLFATLSTLTTGADGLGASLREPPVFTRRGLLAVVDALLHLERIDPVRGRMTVLTAPQEMLGEALRAVTVQRLLLEEDRTRVLDLLRTLDL